jgi:multidrug efflux pump subunit AcrA (membrane-fusion protein)
MNPERSGRGGLFNVYSCLFLLVFAALIFGCDKKKVDKEPAKIAKEATVEKAPESESHVKHGTNGEVIVTVETNLQQKIGLEVKALEAAQVSPEIKSYGRVMDPTPLVQVAADLAIAEAAGQASQSELKRLKTLATENNASERALQAEQAAAVKDQAQIQSIRLKLLTTWGNSISQRSDLPDLVQSLATLASALVLLQVPVGDMLPGSPTGARVYTLGQETNPAPGQVLGPAPAADPQMQGNGFICLISPNTTKLIPNMAVTGLLNFPGQPKSGVLVPQSGVVQFNGGTWVYVQIDADEFERREVQLESPLPNGWFVTAGLKPQDKIVTTGAQQLLSEELKGQIEE